MYKHSSLSIVLACTAFACVGCNNQHPNIVPVSGIVTIDGEPLSVGQVRVLAAEHRPAIGKINEDGTFTLSCFELGDGAPVGTHLATVTAAEQLSETSSRWYAPKKYSSNATSELWVTIEGPTDDLTIELTWDGSGQSGPFVDKY
ncbi:hypothetical protein [Aeoliella sp.]|uniref:hypothetical protein n=1 Tax=Aeoliella sp. TaxID=2795800 RepID=UPI003CCBB90B